MPWRRDRNDDDWARGFFREFEEMERIVESLMRDMARHAEGKHEPILYGWSVERGPEGEPHVREFGNVRPRDPGEPGGPVRVGAREPYVSTLVNEEAGEVKVTAELPGVDRDHVDLDVTENAVHIRGDQEDHRYETTVDLPAPVDRESARARFKNGILEVTLKTEAGPGTEEGA